MIPASLRSLLGLCQRAGKLTSGDLAVEQALRKRKADLMILAADASERTQEKLVTLGLRGRVPIYRLGTRDQLGDAIGKSHRAAVVIQSGDFTKGMLEILKQEGFEPVRGQGESGGTQGADL